MVLRVASNAASAGLKDANERSQVCWPGSDPVEQSHMRQEMKQEVDTFKSWRGKAIRIKVELVSWSFNKGINYTILNADLDYCLRATKWLLASLRAKTKSNLKETCRFKVKLAQFEYTAKLDATKWNSEFKYLQY